MTTIGVDGGKGLDVVGLNVGIVGGLEGAGVLGSDGSEDFVGAVDGGGLISLVFGGRVGSRVVKDEGVLLRGDGCEVTLGNGILESADAVPVDTLGALLGGERNGTISVGDGGDGGKSSTGGGDLAEGSTTVHVQGGAGALL